MNDAAATTRKYPPGKHPSLPPPGLAVGPLLWIKENLFGSVTNTVLTALSIWLLWVTIPPLLHWGIIDAAFTGESRKDCQAQASGACWAFIQNRFELFVYGFYPEAERWRVNMAALLLAVALLPVLWEKTPYRSKLLVFSCAYPFVAGWLLIGGLGLKPVGTDRFGGFLLTMVIGVTGISFSLPIGVLLALGRQSRLPVLRVVSVSFIEFIRGVPLITLLFVASAMLSYFLPPGTNFNLLLRVLIMVTLFASGYMAEVVRGGLQAIPKGQYEAAQSMGLGYWKQMRLVVLPQALKISIPGIVNTFIALYKDTTLVIIIGLLDPLGIGRSSLADSKWQGLSSEVYIFVAIFFFISCFGMSRYALYLERKLDTGHKR
ncbi:MAG: amino acid ABC transporter permease [Rhodospirillales bacterium RIFCSPLOWO2_01_FULL_65_14]|nr:MAG: amino acid ABC transporter permease [Rhodospirillales bacterium RIFCSPLOWO2_01_FULL_65_14]